MGEAALKVEMPWYPSRRVIRPDIMDRSAWLVRRFRERWPHIQPPQILGFLQGCCDSSEYLFVRTEKAFLLAQVQREFVEPYPCIREWFVWAELTNDKHAKGSENEAYQVRTNADAIAQAASLYEDLRRWAEKMSANEITVAKYSDVPLGDKDTQDVNTIRRRLGLKMFTNTEAFARLDPDSRIRRVGT
jgi:hypothetical protein